MSSYIGFKFVHVLIAIISLGSGAASAVLVTFFAGHATHGAFILRVVRTLLWWLVIPGYVLMLATGMWTAHLGALLDAHWTEAAMHLWGLGAILIALATFAVHRTMRNSESAVPTNRRFALLGRLSGAGAGIVMLVMIYLMVFKP